MQHHRARGANAALAVLLTLLLSAPAGAQMPGRITGTAVDAETDDPLIDTIEMSTAPFAVVPTLFETPRDTLDNIDSAAVWHGPAGEHWLLATAKEGDVIVVSDAATGTLVQHVGSEGTGPGQFSRPNGIAVTDSTMWIVERDNARVPLFTALR